MQEGVSIVLTGAGAAEAARALQVRLGELGRGSELFDAEAVKRLGGPRAAGHAGALLMRHGVVVIVTDPRVKPEGRRLVVEVEPHDTPDFAAEKALDALAGAGVIVLASVDYSPDEEERIRKRLADLGYIE